MVTLDSDSMGSPVSVKYKHHFKAGSLRSTSSNSSKILERLLGKFLSLLFEFAIAISFALILFNEIFVLRFVFLDKGLKFMLFL